MGRQAAGRRGQEARLPADPEAAVRRARKAAAERRVTCRPAPDTMAYLTALLPVADAVAAYAALSKDADLHRGGDPRTRVK